MFIYFSSRFIVCDLLGLMVASANLARYFPLALLLVELFLHPPSIKKWRLNSHSLVVIGVIGVDKDRLDFLGSKIDPERAEANVG